MSKHLLSVFIKIMGATVLPFIFLLGFLNIIPYSAMAEPTPKPPPPPPPPPPRGTPPTGRTPGTTRPEQACPILETSLTPINHSQGRDFTVSTYPSFLFYIPYSPENVSYLEFFIQDPQTLATVYRTQVQISATPGIIQITIPSQPSYALALNKTYRWYLRLDCQANAKEPDLLWMGFVRRVSQDPTLENQLSSESSRIYRAYMNQEIWYDAVTSAAELRLQNPDEFNKAWSEVLESLDLENLDGKPFSDSVQISPTN